METSETTIRIERDGGWVRVILNRPDVRNAFNATMIAEVRAAFERLGGDPSVRAIELRGAGPVFSAGADLAWMQASLDLTEADNVRDATAMAEMFGAIDRCSKPVIARVHKAAIAGGSGLCAVADIVIAADDATFGFTETRLGILPAVISPFVIAKIGVSHARALFLSGERFHAARALHIGLVHDVVPAADLDARIATVRAEIEAAGPHATAAAKRLIAAVIAAPPSEVTALTTAAIASARASVEGQDGLRAFLEHREPTWRQREPAEG